LDAWACGSWVGTAAAREVREARQRITSSRLEDAQMIFADVGVDGLAQRLTRMMRSPIWRSSSCGITRNRRGWARNLWLGLDYRESSGDVVTSANFTFFGLHRNIEIGIRISGAPAHEARKIF
jgi:hypothetical protein